MFVNVREEYTTSWPKKRYVAAAWGYLRRRCVGEITAIIKENDGKELLEKIVCRFQVNF